MPHAFLQISMNYIILILTTLCFSAEIQFKPTVQCDTATVTLGDVAEITGQQANTLKEIPLFPAPIAGGQRTVSATQIRDMLGNHGVSSLDNTFTGVGQITIKGPNKSATAKNKKNAEDDLTETLRNYLNRCTTDGTPENAIPWSLKLQLTPEQVKAFAEGGKIIGMYGGKNPLIGRQEFQAELQGVNPESGRRNLVRFFADIELPPKIIVAKRSLQRGKILNENDIRVIYRDDIKGNDYYSDPHDVIGKAAASNIRDGAILTSQAVQKPTLIRKGEMVTVNAKAGGIIVTTTAKALDDGGLGDLIALEQQLKPKQEKGRAAVRSMKEDSTFVARVCDIGTVEVFVSGNKY